MTESVEGSLESVASFLRENPAYIPILTRIVKVEEQPPDVEAEKLGWKWHHVGVPPAKLHNLIYASIVKIVYESRSSTNYRIINLEVVKEALRQVNVKEENLDEIPPDLFDTIIGYEQIKHLFMGIILKDARVHVLMEGSPASGKTLFLMEFERLPGAVYGLASGSSKAGLTELLFDKQPKYLLLDEAEKMENAKDLSVLLSLMETGRIREIKFHRHRETTLHTKIFAACNSKRDLPREFLSRFTQLRFPDYTLQQSKEISERVLTKREGFEENPDLASYIAEQVIMRLRSMDVRDSIRVGRIVTSQGTQQDVDRIIATLTQYK